MTVLQTEPTNNYTCTGHFNTLNSIEATPSLLLMQTPVCEHVFCSFTRYSCGIPLYVVTDAVIVSHLLSGINVVGLHLTCLMCYSILSNIVRSRLS